MKTALSILLSVSILVGCSSSTMPTTTGNVQSRSPMIYSRPCQLNCNTPPPSGPVFSEDDEFFANGSPNSFDYTTTAFGYPGYPTIPRATRFNVIGGPIMMNGVCAGQMALSAIAAARSIFNDWRSLSKAGRANFTPIQQEEIDEASDTYAEEGGFAAGGTAAWTYLVAVVTAAGVAETASFGVGLGLSGYTLYLYIACLAKKK